MASQDAAKTRDEKRRERIKRATSAKNKAQEALLLLEEQLAHQACRLVQAHAPPAQVEQCLEGQDDAFIPLPQPPGWENVLNVEETLDKAKLRELTINQKIPTAIADAGATSNCGMDYESSCGRYKMQDPFQPTGQTSDKIFQYAGGNLAAATTIKQLPLNVRTPAKEVHIVPGINNNLISTSKFVDANYAWVFDNDEVAVYDKNNTEIKTTWAAVFKGWRGSRRAGTGA